MGLLAGEGGRVARRVDQQELLQLALALGAGGFDDGLGDAAAVRQQVERVEPELRVGLGLRSGRPTPKRTKGTRLPTAGRAVETATPS